MAFALHRPLWPIFLALCLGLIPTGPAHGEAFRILDQGASASGQGTAFAAQADDPSALHYNPAGMTQLRGVQVSAGTLLVGGHVSFDNPSGQQVKGNFDGTIVDPPPFNFYLTAHLPDLGFTQIEGLTLGIGVNTPFGLLINYPKDGPFSTVFTRAALPLLDFKPTLAFALNQYLSFGVGLDIYTFASFAGEGGVEGQRIAGAPFAPIGITPGSQLEFNGKDSSVGFNLSTRVTPLRDAAGQTRLALAFIYRSETTLNLDGVFLDDGGLFDDATVVLTLPHVFTGGMAIWPIRNDHLDWKVEADLDYADWSGFTDLDVQLANGIVLPRPRNWGDAFVIKLGSEVKWLQPAQLPDWTLSMRGGYIFSKTPVPEVTFEPAVPDANYHALSIGLGLSCAGQGRLLGLFECEQGGAGLSGIKGIAVDLAYKVRLYEERNITDNRLTVLNGRWDTIIHAGILNLGLFF